MLPMVGDFLKSTFGESLKKPLQPAGLFAAAIFLFLNILFVFPTLVDQNEPLAIAIRDMGAAPQIALAAVLVLVLAYLLLSMGGSILKLMDGELWADSPWVGMRLVDAHCSSRRSLKRAVWDRSELDAPDRRADRRQSLFQINTDYPPAGARVAPTALGNVLYATVAYLWDRYRIDMTVLWPHMETVVAGETALAARLDNEKAALDFLLNLAFVLIAFAAEYAALRFSLRQFPELVYSLGFVFLAWCMYRAAVSKARSWGAAVQLSFDLHRDKLRRALGMRPFSSDADERESWRRMSRWLLWAEPPGNVLAFGADASAPAPVDKPIIVTSANTAVTTTRATVVEQFRLEDHAAERQPVSSAPAGRWSQALDYVLLVSNATTSGETPVAGRELGADGASVLVCDPRVVSLADPVLDRQARRDGWQVSRVPSGRHHSPEDLLWTMRRLPPNGSRVLRYRLPLAALNIDAAPHLRISNSSSVSSLDGLLAYDISLDLQPDRPWQDLLEQTRALTIRVSTTSSCAQAVGRALPGRLAWADAPLADPTWVTPESDRACLSHVWTIEPRNLPGVEHRHHGADAVRLRYQVLADPPFELADRLLAILAQLKVCRAITSPLRPDEVGLDAGASEDACWDALLRSWVHGWDSFMASGAPESWARVVLQMAAIAKLPDDPEDPGTKASALNNLGCAWMWFCQWDRAEKAFRDALAPFVKDHRENNPGWEEGDPRPRSAKEAADYNLDALNRARDAWMRGT
jgi:hypothetical protein